MAISLQDADFARTDQYTCTLIQTQKFVEVSFIIWYVSVFLKVG